MFRLWIRVRDADGDTSTLTLNFPSSFSITEVLGFADGFITLLDAIITGKVEEAGISVVVTLPGGLRANPVAYSDVQHGALMSWGTDGNYRTSYRVPTFNPAMFATGSKNVDVEDSDVAAVLTAMISGIDVSATMVEPSDYRGDDINALIKGVESFRK